MLERAAHTLPRCFVVSMKITARAGGLLSTGGTHPEKGALPPGTCFNEGRQISCRRIT